MIRNVRLEEPPTSDEMLEYLRGGFSPSEEADFRARVMPYPELVRTFTADFPSEGAQPGEDDYLPDAEFARHWAAIQKRMTAPAGRIAQGWPSIAALAAAVALVFGMLYWNARTYNRQPRVLVVDAQPLQPDGRSRGGGSDATTVTAAGDSYSLVPVLMDAREFESYRVELFDRRVEPQRSLWSTSDLHRTDDATLVVVVPRSFLSRGVYRLSVYGVVGGSEEHINDYTIRVLP